MAGRIIIKPFRTQRDSLHEWGENDNLYWRATPEFSYVGMPDYLAGKKHYGKGLTPWDAVQQLAQFLPRELRAELQQRNESEIYLRPDTHNPSERVIEMNGHKPDKAEWLQQRQYFNTYGSLYYYFKQQTERSL
jgi:hypothetical protein